MKNLRCAIFLTGWLFAGCVEAQVTTAFPGKQVHWVVPFAAGGPVDVMSRALAEKLAQRWGQTVLIDNRAGAGGSIGAELVAKATPDGHTLMTGHVGTHAINVTLFRKLPYDPARDFTPISLVAFTPFVLLTPPTLPVRDAKDLIALAKARPGQLNYASAGNGGPTHLIPEMFKTMASVKIVQVPYKGNSAALTDLVAGQVQMMFSNLLTSMPFVRVGKLRAIGVSTAKRLPQEPAIPTIAESGLPGFDATAWYGVLGPAGLPGPLLARLNTDIVQTLALADMRERFVPQGIELTSSTPDYFAALIKTEIVKWRKIVNDAGAVGDQ